MTINTYVLYILVKCFLIEKNKKIGKINTSKLYLLHCISVVNVVAKTFKGMDKTCITYSYNKE